MMDTIDRIRVESDENGWELVLEGDFVETFERYLASETCLIRLSLHGAAFEFACSEGLGHLAEWAADGRAVAREMAARGDTHDGDGYDLDDPKHPTWHDRMVD